MSGFNQRNMIYVLFIFNIITVCSFAIFNGRLDSRFAVSSCLSSVEIHFFWDRNEFFSICLQLLQIFDWSNLIIAPRIQEKGVSSSRVSGYKVFYEF